MLLFLFLFLFHKQILAEGTSIIETEKADIESAIKGIRDPDTKEYRALRSRQNIINQFEKIQMKNIAVFSLLYRSSFVGTSYSLEF